jgi:GAF domain-containing protein
MDRERRLRSASDGKEPSKLTRVVAARQAIRLATASEQWLDPDRSLPTSTSMAALLEEALQAIARVLDAHTVELLLVDDDGTGLVPRAACGVGRDAGPATSVPAGSGISGSVLRSDEPGLLRELSPGEASSPSFGSSSARSYVGVPLRADERRLGVLQATSRAPDAFDQSDLELLALLAEPITSAIDRARLFRAEQSAQFEADEARSRANRTTERLRGLQRITAALAGTSTATEVCSIILDEAGAGGTQETGERAIWMFEDSRLVLVAGSDVSMGYPEIPLDPSLPAAETLQSGLPLFVESRAEVARRWPALADSPTVSFAALPLIVEGRRLGVLAVGFREEHTFSPAGRDYLTTIAEQAAGALARAEATAALQDARDLADLRRDQLAYLAQASARLAGSLDLEVTLRTIAQLIVPRITDRCALYLVEGKTITKQVLAPAELTDDEVELFERDNPTLSALGGAGAVVRTGEVLHIPEIDDAMLAARVRSSAQLDLVRRVGLGGLLLLPLRARGRNLGVLAFVNRPGRPVSQFDRALGEELTARAALALDNALAYQREADVASRLSATLRPSRLPEIAGLDLAAHYEAGTTNLDVGGDFYDFFQTGPDTWLVAVGDVQGKGVEAAAVTGLVRHTIKSAAVFESSPAELLRHLNQAHLRHIVETAQDPEFPWDDARLCTAVLIRLDRVEGSWLATISSAGHPLPILRRPDRTYEAVGASGLLLGVSDDARYKESVSELHPGSCLVCFTDGVSESRVNEQSLGVEGIARIAIESRGTAQEIADAISNAALRSGVPQDDQVVLTICVSDPA